MTGIARLAAAAGTLAILASPASALTSFLYDFAVNVDGVVTAGTPGSVNPADLGLDPNGRGTFIVEVTGAGAHAVAAFFDFAFDEPNNTFFNEYGAASGAPAPGQSREIDEPGYVFGDIRDNALANSLDNTNAVPQGEEADASFALGWNFLLAAGETAQVAWTLSDVPGTGGFHLRHTDDETGVNFDVSESMFYWSTLTISGDADGRVVPIPASLALLSTAAAGLGLLGARRRRPARL